MSIHRKLANRIHWWRFFYLTYRGKGLGALESLYKAVKL